jgi:hypothetical protein
LIEIITPLSPPHPSSSEKRSENKVFSGAAAACSVADHRATSVRMIATDGQKETPFKLEMLFENTAHHKMILLD